MIPQLSRNELIRLRFTAGESLSELARAFGISPQRAHQIVNFKQPYHPNSSQFMCSMGHYIPGYVDRA